MKERMIWTVVLVITMVLVPTLVCASTPPDDVQKDIAFVEEVNALMPSTIFIAVFKESNREQIQNVLLAGARAFSVQPLNKKDFESTLNRVIELQERLIRSTLHMPDEEEEEEKPHKTLIVSSPRGGVGTTTIASNLAIAIQNKTRNYYKSS